MTSLAKHTLLILLHQDFGACILHAKSHFSYTSKWFTLMLCLDITQLSRHHIPPLSTVEIKIFKKRVFHYSQFPYFALSFIIALIITCIYMCMCVKSLQSCLTLCEPMDYNPPSPLSVRFSGQESWSGLPFPPPGDLPALAGGLFITSATWEAHMHIYFYVTSHN